MCPAHPGPDRDLPQGGEGPDSSRHGQTHEDARTRLDQRTRLLGAFVQVVGEEGYLNVKVGDIARRAGVSRATFYEQFSDKEACFLTAHRQLAARLCEQTAGVENGPGEGAARRVVAALVAQAQSDPVAFYLLTHEALLAGTRAVAERDRLIEAIAQKIQVGWSRLSAERSAPILPATMLVGGTIRVLGLHMRAGLSDPGELLEDMLSWVASYEIVGGALRTPAPAPPGAFAADRSDAGGGPRAPQPLPRGRHRQPAEVVSRIQRERILYAAGKVAREKGYAAATVRDIVAAAGVSREVFYAHFRDKREACLEALQLVAEQMAGVGATAFYTAVGEWPERVWQIAAASARYIASAPDFAYFALVESYALGPEGEQYADGGIRGYAMFLEEGYRQRPEATQVPRLTSHAIAGVVMETSSHYVRSGRGNELPGLLPIVAHLCLVPFIGIAAADEFVQSKLAQAGL
jgi:AcrR family transcriptional regulator